MENGKLKNEKSMKNGNLKNNVIKKLHGAKLDLGS
jgi:antitoxin component YwqK of YwqJK toxin-antitoxin module